MYIRFYREAGAGSGAGDLPPSLQDIEKKAQDNWGKNPGDPNPDPNKPPVTDDSGIKPGDGKDKIPSIGDTKPAPEGKVYNAQGELIDDPNYKKPNTDTPPEGKKYNEKGELIDDPDYKKPDTDNKDKKPNTDESLDFWQEVEKQTGRKVEVKYPEGIEADTVEGAVIREAAVREDAVNEWEESLRARFPRVMAYAIHHMDGGSDADFLNNERGISLPERTVVESTVDVQTSIFKNDLLAKGVDPEVVDASVAASIKNNTLKDKALKIYDNVKTAQATELAELQTRQKNENDRVNRVIATATNRIEKVLPELGFVVPETDKQKFMDFVTNNMFFDRTTGKFIIQQELNIDDPKVQLESLFFQYGKGDLEKIIAKKVSTKAAQKLRLQADKTKTTPTNHTDDTNKTDNYVPLGSMGPGARR